MPEQVDQAIRERLCICFPDDCEYFSHTRPWHDCVPAWSVLIEDDSGEIIAHAGIIDRTIEVNDQHIRIAGAQNVFVLPEYRGKHVVKQLLDAAMKYAAQNKFDCGLLCCHIDRERIYARCGWHTIPNRPIIRVDETGKEVPLAEHKIAMCYPLSLRKFPPGTVHLKGNTW